MDIILIITALLLGMILVIVTVPPIIRVAKAKHLFDSHEERKIHKGVIPPLGGIAIFIGFILSTIMSTDGYSFDS